MSAPVRSAVPVLVLASAVSIGYSAVGADRRRRLWMGIKVLGPLGVVWSPA